MVTKRITARSLYEVIGFNVVALGALVVIVVHLAMVWSLGVPRRLVTHNNPVDAFSELGFTEGELSCYFSFATTCSTLAASLFRRSERHETGWWLSPLQTHLMCQAIA